MCVARLLCRASSLLSLLALCVVGNDQDRQRERDELEVCCESHTIICCTHLANDVPNQAWKASFSDGKRLVRVTGIAQEEELRAMLRRLRLDMNKVGLRTEMSNFVAFEEALNSHPDVAVLGAGLSVDVGDNATFGIDYAGQLGDRASEHSGSARFSMPATRNTDLTARSPQS